MSTNDKALAIMPQNLDEVSTLATRFAKSNLLPEALRGKEADVFVTILAGRELGLPPMASLRSVHVINGKPVLSADAMTGVVLGRGIARYFSCVAESDTSVTYETHRDGDPSPQRMTWTVADAKTAGLIPGKPGSGWARFPRAMLKARCKAALARDVYPDVLAGCYDPDEAREFSPEPRRAIDVEPEVSSTASAAADAVIAKVIARDDTAPGANPELDQLLDAIDAAPDMAALKALAPRANALAKGSAARQTAMEAWKARQEWLTVAAAARDEQGATP